MIPVFIISLARAPERRSVMRAQLEALHVPFTLIDAVDGIRLSEQEAHAIAPRRRRLTLRWPLSNGEIACAASHRLAIERIRESGAEFGCVMEDDGKPDSTFPEFLDADWLGKLPRFDILKLAGDEAGRRELLAVPLDCHAGHQICVPLHPSYSMRCYVVSRHGAQRVLRHLRRIDDSVDVMVFRRPMTGMRFLDVRPVVAGVTGAESTLHADRWRNAPAPWWRPILTWAPYRLALIERKARRYLTFLRTLGPGGFRRLEVIPLELKHAAAGRERPRSAPIV
jgi:glycosyl transferase, family 25